MLHIRKSEDRGHEDHGWLNTYHAFSFASYYDPRFMGFRDLLVINEDRVTSGKGFPTHAHDNMEIISYVLEGALAHKDSMGTGSTIVPGDVQRMSAGTGVRHSEYNDSQTEGLHFLQIWIKPDTRGIAPSYEQKRFSTDDKRGRLRVVASPDGRDGSVTIRQDALLYATVLAAGDSLNYDLDPERYAWVQVARSNIELNGQPLKQGDGAAIGAESQLTLTATADAEILLFDLN